MSDFVYLSGRLVPQDEATVSVFDAGFSHGAGLFETLRAYNGRIMSLSAHIERLNLSASTLEIPVALDVEQIRDAADQLMEANDLREARLRLTVTPGNVPRPGQDPSEDRAPTVLLVAEQVRPYPKELYESGMRVCICPYRQNPHDPLAGHKTLGYLPRLLAMKDASAKRCHEALWFTTDNRLAEGSVSNVFIVRDGMLVTPPTNTPCLPGTVRKSILELASANNVGFSEAAISIEELLAASEVFLTGSVLEVMPVTSIERHSVGAGVPGELTKKFAEWYRGMVREQCADE